MNIQSNEEELIGVEFSCLMPAEGINASPKAGRPIQIDKQLLLNRRSTIHWHVEEHWSDFAWALKKSSSIAAIRAALAPLKGIPEFALYVLPCTFSNVNEVSCNRKHKKATGQQLRSMIRATQALEYGYSLNSAQQVLRSSKEDKAIIRIVAEREEAFTTMKRQCDNLRAKLNKLIDQVRNDEAYRCQNEALHFVTSKRYTLNPVTLSNALAGLPEVKWRTSFSLCSTVETTYSGSMNYLIFKEFEQAIRLKPKMIRSAIAQIRAALQSSRSANREVRSKLRNEFYYIEEAIKAVHPIKMARAEFPYKVCSEYLRRISTRSQLDILKEGEFKL